MTAAGETDSLRISKFSRPAQQFAWKEALSGIYREFLADLLQLEVKLHLTRSWKCVETNLPLMDNEEPF